MKEPCKECGIGVEIGVKGPLFDSVMCSDCFEKRVNEEAKE